MTKQNSPQKTPEDLKVLVDQTASKLSKIEKAIEETLKRETPQELHKVWDKMRPVMKKMRLNLEESGKRVRTMTEEAELQVYLGLKEGQDMYHTLENDLREFVNRTKEKERQWHTKMDTAKVMAHLMQMEAKDYLAEGKTQFMEQYAQSKQKTKHKLYLSFEKMNRALSDLLGPRAA